MTRVDAYLFKNSLRLIRHLVESSPMAPESKDRIIAEIESMITVLDRISIK